MFCLVIGKIILKRIWLGAMYQFLKEVVIKIKSGAKEAKRIGNVNLAAVDVGKKSEIKITEAPESLCYFYRVEDDNGCGPYYFRPKSHDTWMSCNHRRQPELVSRKHNIRYEIMAEPFVLNRMVKANKLLSDCIFGFTSLNQLQAWFRPEELRKLTTMGYKIKRVLGNPIINTSTQSMFVRLEK